MVTNYDLSVGDVNFSAVQCVQYDLSGFSSCQRERVQGVYYRSSTLEKARSLNICGYVKNQHDGSVKLDAEGTKEQLNELLRWCHLGPPGASVESVETTWLNELQHYPNFSIQHEP